MGRWLAALLLLLSVCGCGHEGRPVAQLLPQDPQALQDWGVPAHLHKSGSGNSVRVVRGTASGTKSALELAAGGTGELEYDQELAGDQPFQVQGEWEFLSTQGAGRVTLRALDGQDKEIASLGWVYTGKMPTADEHTQWVDARYIANYTGDWLELDEDGPALFAKYLPTVDVHAAVKYRLSVVAGQGQHVLIQKLQINPMPLRDIKIKVANPVVTARWGELIPVEVDVTNPSPRAITDISLEISEPEGYGLVVVQDKVQIIPRLEAGEKRSLIWQVRAQRPDAVNGGKPWQLKFSLGGVGIQGQTAIQVADSRPGKIFYVMTEDLEPIDAAGYPVAWGNQSGWLQPEELQVQMVTKAERVNAIAQEFGAKWTHYIAWPVVKAADWAAGQSKTGQWQQTVASIERSVKEQSAQGHEYAIHMHSDYDPYLPGNVLSYDPGTDGLWANHLRHGWAHSFPVEGDFSNYASRTGMLYAYQRILEELTADSRQGQLITTRAGSFDFGDSRESQGMSTRVYRKIGLWGTSDAAGNVGKSTSAAYGKEIYFAKPDDITMAINDMVTTGLVEFRPTPQDCLDYSTQSAALLNQKAAEGMAAFIQEDGKVKPGVHAIISFTHLMFMLGDGDWKNVEGGQFAVLASHLKTMKEQYVDQGKLTFATADELVKSYLDYYTPQPLALYGPRTYDTWGVAEYPILILGKDIPLDSAHPQTLSLKYPLYFRDSAYFILVLKNGVPIYSTGELPTAANDIRFTADDLHASYTMKVYHNELLGNVLGFFQKVKVKLGLGSKF